MNIIYLSHVTDRSIWCWQSTCRILLTGVTGEHHLPVACHLPEYQVNTIYMSHVTYRSSRWTPSTWHMSLIEVSVYTIYLSYVTDRSTQRRPSICRMSLSGASGGNHLPVAIHWSAVLGVLQIIFLTHVTDRSIRYTLSTCRMSVTVVPVAVHTSYPSHVTERMTSIYL